MTFRFTRGALAAAAACLGLFATTARADLPEFFGNWINNDVNTPDITRIVVMPAGGNNVMVHVWAQCYPTDCDWGVVPGHSYVDTFNQQNVNIVTAQYNPGFARTLVILRTAGGTLRIQALTEFTDGSGRSDYEYRGGLHRVPYFPPVIPMPKLPPVPLPLQPKWPPIPTPHPLPIPAQPVQPGFQPVQPNLPHPLPILLGPEDCVGFSTFGVQAVQQGGSWLVMDGPHSLLDFGPDKAGAMHAVGLIKSYGFNQQCFVKRPHAAMAYWRVGGTVPKNALPGQDCIAFNTANVTVQNIGGRWKVVDGEMWMLDYAGDKAAAETALSVIKVYHLNRQCFAGAPARVMNYWLAQ